MYISECSMHLYGIIPNNVHPYMQVLILCITCNYRIAGIFRGYKFSRNDHWKGIRGFNFRGIAAFLHLACMRY